MSDPYQYNPEEVLKTSIIDEYKSLHKDIVYSLNLLNTNIAIIEQILDFRWDFYQSPTAFFSLVLQDIFEYNIVIVHRIFVDSSSKSITIKKLHELVEKGIKKEYRNSLNNYLENLRQERKKIKGIVRKIDSLRDKYFAHRDRQDIFNSKVSSDLKVGISELKKVAKYLEEYFKALTFGCEYKFVAIQLLKDKDQGQQSELDYIFDLFALQSKWIEGYDKHPSHWERNLRKQLTEEDLKEINEIRKRFNLKQIPENLEKIENT